MRILNVEPRLSSAPKSSGTPSDAQYQCGFALISCAPGNIGIYLISLVKFRLKGKKKCLSLKKKTFGVNGFCLLHATSMSDTGRLLQGAASAGGSVAAWQHFLID